MHGIMELDAKAGRMQPVLTARNSESFKGCNDLHHRLQWRHLFHRPGTDRPARSDRAGLSAVAERAARLPDRYRHQPQRPGARSHETVLFVAMTRDNAVWRLPFMKDGSVSKVGRFCSTFGASGPDGMTMDKQAGCSWRMPRSDMCSCSRRMAN
jgi:gluconolactonase